MKVQRSGGKVILLSIVGHESLTQSVMKVVKEPIDLVVPNRPYKRPGLGTDPVRWATVTAG